MNQVIDAVYEGGALRPSEPLDLLEGQRVRIQMLSEEETMSRPPISSVLASVAYLPTSEALELAFQDGSAYLYFDVPAQVHDDLMQAESRGRYFNTHIRTAFAARKTK